MSAIPARKSFAQVAAEAQIKIIPKENLTNTITPNVNPSTTTKLSNAALARLSNAPEGLTDGSSTGQQSTNTPTSGVSEVEQLNELLRTVTLQDGQLHILEADHISRREYDTKSVASRTTHTLDEKESLRPDDSASMQAAPEEDAFSPAGSIVAGVNGGSDPDVRAFRDQLNGLERVAPGRLLAQRPLAGPGLVADLRGEVSAFSTPPSGSPFAPMEASSFERPKILPMPFVPPDEKLLEALASPKDRLFVLKIEQDMIDFVKDSKEEFLQLPQMNAFYRMLSHKLADYYLLGHLIDESLSSVRIFRTQHCQLPPPLIGPNSSADGSATPPAVMPTRKIMRRGGDGNDLRLSSRTPSKGGDDDKEKGALTREERENRYKEARARIFKDFKEELPESTDTAVKASEKDVSRSSSASGAKQTKKKKKHRDDEFEPRSAFTGLAPFSPPTTQSNSDGTFYNPFAPYAFPAQQPGMLASFDPNMHGQIQMPMSVQYVQQTPQLAAWSAQQGAQPYAMQQPGVPGYPSQAYYDNSGSYNNISSPPSMTNQLTPRATNPSLAPQSQSPSQDSDGQGWQQNYANQYPNQSGYSQAFYDPSMMHNPMMYSNPGYPLQEAQSMAQQQAAFFAEQSRQQQFNPQTQAFVPGWRQMPQQTAPAHYFNNAMLSQFQPQQVPQPVQQPQPSFPQQYTPQPHANVSRVTGQHQLRPPPGPGTSRPALSVSSTIAKWGTPSTLPPKPPPPAIFSPFVELPRDSQNQQPLPPNPYTSGMRQNGVTRVSATR